MFSKSSLQDVVKVRTKGQQMINPTAGAAAMIRQIRTSFHHGRADLLQDAIGVAALVVMLLVVLYLPGLF
jgi:hypothetical protein